MSRLMFVTVGTSLFHSASWEPADGLPVEIPYYQRWLADDKLRSPDARMVDRRGDSIRDRLRGALNEDNVREWARCLPAKLLEGNPEPETIVRYSAELTTILALSASEKKPIREFLRGYSRIYVMIDTDRGTTDAKGKTWPNLSRVAGVHLAAYLSEIAGAPRAQEYDVAGISSTAQSPALESVRKLAEAIQHRQAEVHATEVDLILSGGYKLYGIALGRLAKPRDPRVRLVYMHEAGEELILYDGESLEAGLMPAPAHKVCMDWSPLEG